MKKLVILCFALTVSLLSSCQKGKDVNPDEQGSAIAFTAEIYTSEKQSVVSRNTSASKEAFVNGDEIGLFVVPFKNPTTAGDLFSSGNFADNVPFKMSGSQFNATSGNTINFPSATTKVALYAFGMYNTQYNTIGTNNPSAVEWTIDADQSLSDGSSIVKNDIMTAQNTLVDPTVSSSPVLTFKHRLSIAQIEFEAPSFIGGSAVSNLSVKLNNLNDKVLINMIDNTVNPVISGSTKSDFTARQVTKTVASNKTTYMYEVIVAPQTIAASEQIATVVFTTADQVEHTYLCSLSDIESLNFQSGFRTKLLFSFDEEPGTVTIGTTEITRWEDASMNLIVSTPYVLNFKIEEESSKTVAADVNRATIMVDGGAAVPASVKWDATREILECSFVLLQSQFPEKLTGLSLYKEGGGLIAVQNAVPAITSSGIHILGDPTEQGYDTIISTIVLRYY